MFRVVLDYLFQISLNAKGFQRDPLHLDIKLLAIANLTRRHLCNTKFKFNYHFVFRFISYCLSLPVNKVCGIFQVVCALVVVHLLVHPLFHVVKLVPLAHSFALVNARIVTATG